MSKLWSQVLGKFTIGDGCWEWQAANTPQGYGVVRVAGRLTPAHRVLYELMIGPIPEGLHIDHLCRNRRCVRPCHLEPVSQRENNLRGVSGPADNARKTHCVRGHPFDQDNLVALTGYTWRRCKVCHAERERKYRAAHRS